MSSSSFIREQFGYVENVKEEYQYQNVDYRDTLVPLWNTLYNRYFDSETQKPRENNNQNNQNNQNDQNEINLALCATLIQLGKHNKFGSDYLYEKLQEIEEQIYQLEKRISSLEKNYKR